MGTGWKLVRESHFTLPGPVFSFKGTVETSLSPGWQSVRAKKGSVSYVIVPLVDISVYYHQSEKRIDVISM